MQVPPGVEPLTLATVGLGSVPDKSPPAVVLIVQPPAASLKSPQAGWAWVKVLGAVKAVMNWWVTAAEVDSAACFPLKVDQSVDDKHPAWAPDAA